MAEPKRQARREIPNDEMYQILETMIGKGNTGLVQLTDCGTRVRKIPIPWFSVYDPKIQCKQLRREIAAYKHLPTHRRLVRMLEYEDDGDEGVSITLEFMPNLSLRQRLAGGAMFMKQTQEEKERGAAISARQRASWALEATDAVMLLHAHDIIHADIRPENMVLDQHLNIRIIDLSGCSLRGEKALSLESASFYMPRTAEIKNSVMGCSVITDLFALGSSFYQIATCYAPWADVNHREIEARFARDEFPDLATSGANGGPLLFATVIRRCWHAEFATAASVLEALKAEIRASFSADEQACIENQSGISLQPGKGTASYQK